MKSHRRKEEREQEKERKRTGQLLRGDAEYAGHEFCGCCWQGQAARLIFAPDECAEEGGSRSQAGATPVTFCIILHTRVRAIEYMHMEVSSCTPLVSNAALPSYSRVHPLSPLASVFFRFCKGKKYPG